MGTNFVERWLGAAGLTVIVLLTAISQDQFLAVPGQTPWFGSLHWYGGLILVLSIASYVVGLPNMRPGKVERLVAAAAATLFGVGAIALCTLASGRGLLPRTVLLATATASVPWLYLVSAVASQRLATGQRRDRVLLVAEDRETAMLELELSTPVERPVDMVRTLNVMSEQLARRDLDAAFNHSQPTVLVLDQAAVQNPLVISWATDVHRTGVRIRTLSMFYEQWLTKLPISELEHVSLLFDVGELHSTVYLRLKRALDIAIALCCLPALALAIPVVAAVNRLANRGSLLFRQPRVGKDGERFLILKFRTMVPQREGDGQGQWTRVDDPRITGFGNVLRKSHLDELPQVWNVLRGDLSIVGPRPEQPHYVEELTEKIPYYEFRHIVRPGITGWAQVKYPYGSDVADALEKLQYDLFYMRRQTLVLDARILARTFRNLFGSSGLRGR